MKVYLKTVTCTQDKEEKREQRSDASIVKLKPTPFSVEQTARLYNYTTASNYRGVKIRCEKQKSSMTSA